MSPIWVKLGDFGASKRIRAQATTALHTQVSTPVYAAPEVLGLDSNSETSNYTNSVDIWSVGCVTYELLVGTKPFASDGQVLRYYFEKSPFPEDQLQELSPPTDGVGISLLKSMLSIQPDDRPTAASALNHRWLAGLNGGNGDNGDDRDEVTQSRDEGGKSRKSRDKRASRDRPKKKLSERNPSSRDNPGCTWPRKSESTPQNFQTPRFGGLKALGKKQIWDISPTCLQSRTLNARPNLDIYVQDLLLTRIGCSNIDPLQPQRISQPLARTKDIVSDQAHGQVTQHNTPTLQCQSTTSPRNLPPTPPAEIAESEIAQPSIHYKILTPAETLMLAGVLTGILMLGILKVMVILAGILMLARVLTRDGTLISEEIEAWGGTEHQPWTDLEPSDVGTLVSKEIEAWGGTEHQPWPDLESPDTRALTRIPMPDRTPAPPEISTSGGTEHKSRTEPKLSVAEHRQEREAIPWKEVEDA